MGYSVLKKILFANILQEKKKSAWGSQAKAITDCWALWGGEKGRGENKALWRDATIIIHNMNKVLFQDIQE